MRNVEAAAKVLHEIRFGDDEGLVDCVRCEKSVRRILSAQFVADVGCERCKGTYRHDGIQCLAVHVDLVNPYDGKVVYANPDKVEWRCVVPPTRPPSLHHRIYRGGPPSTCVQAHGKPYDTHAYCGWQPRWVPKPLEKQP